MARLSGVHNWRQDLRIYCLSLLARRIPLPIWYIGSRLSLYHQKGISASVTLTGTALEYIFIALSGMVFYILLVPWYVSQQIVAWPLFAFLSIILILTFIFRPGLAVELINLILRLFKKPAIPFSISRKDLLIWFLFYLTTWFFDGLGLYFTITAFIPNAPPAVNALGVATITSLVAMVTMILPSGFAIKELTMGALLGAWVPVVTGIILAFIYRIILTLVETLLAFVTEKISEKNFLPPD